jgi:hypothetical protein
MGALEEKELLWCLLCNKRYSLRDVREGRYRGGTGICSTCYTSMAKSMDTCFGKIAWYDAEAEECGSFCPDRKVCKEFIPIPKRHG